ncbi:hypothetical protein ANCCAN_19082 [Ancylostoma caninum]|uniref:Uncharacterized protein n=1 Tax=Ancylostoma caninum TaxID=29170 RepID=A0A368FS56_ANCCA|nr:hypothetical protein ANCCAN_19082 [Ancylostoma caninum]
MSIKFEDYDDYGPVQREANLPPTSHPETNVFAPNQANDVPSGSVFRIQEGPDIKFHNGNGCIFPAQECDYDVSQLLDIHAASFKEQADALLQTGNLSLMTLGEVVASQDCNSEYQVVNYKQRNTANPAFASIWLTVKSEIPKRP